MKQVCCWRGPTASLSTTANFYYPFFGHDGSNNASELYYSCVAAAAGTFRDFVVNLSGAPGAGTGWTFTIYKNGTVTSMTVTISDAATTGRDTVNEVTVAAGDRLGLLIATTGTPSSNVKPRYSVEFESQTDTTSIYAVAPVLMSNATLYRRLFTGGAWGATLSNQVSVAPTGGTITTLYIRERTTRGHSSTHTFVIMKNGVAQDGSGGTPNTTIALTASQTQGSSSFSLSVAAGDELAVRFVPTSVVATMEIGHSIAFNATTAGESILAGHSASPNTGADQSSAFSDGADGFHANSYVNIGHPTSFDVRDLYWRLVTAPGAGNSWTFTARKGGVNTAMTVTIADSATTAIDLTNEFTVADTNTFDVLSQPVSGPTSSIMTWSAVQFISATIQGSAVFGVHTTVTKTRAMAIGLDGNTNTLSEEGKFKVFGKGEFTDTVTLALGPAVAGVASAVDSEVALFDGTTGRKIKRATQTGVAKVASGVLSASNVNLASEVTGDLPFANLVQASAASRLVGRGSAAGAGDFQEITLGSGLSMSGTQLSATAGGSPGGGDGDSTHTAAYASRPAASNDGDLFLPSNGFVIERDTGAAWVPWGPLFPFTAPVSGDFAWVNQGTATVSTTNGGIYMTKTSTAAHDVNVRKKAAPATPYTITAAFLAVRSGTCLFGLTFREAGTGELHTFGYGLTGDQLNSSKWTSPTAFSAHYTQSTMASLMPMAAGLVWLRIADDGSNRKCLISADGQNWFEFHSVTRTDFLTADEVGFFIHTQATANMIGITLLSWAQG